MNWNPSTKSENTVLQADTAAAVSYVRGSFERSDRLAIVALNKKAGTVLQRIERAEQIVSREYMEWLSRKNQEQFEIYISMNALKIGATGRTKADVAEIRHLYLDFDHDGTAALARLRARHDLPEPNYVLNTSPDKWQVVWQVKNFEADQAEALQRSLAWSAGADTAATDRARVLRLPGFYNHKYDTPHPVQAEAYSNRIHVPDDFRAVKIEDRPRHGFGRRATAERSGESERPITQSEKDWAFAKRALARGVRPEAVIAAIAVYRRYDKPDPQYYAELTVRNAEQSLLSQQIHKSEPER